jgi:hypothetical protein
VLESATAPLIAAIAAMTRIILRNIGASPSHLCVDPSPTVPPKRHRPFQTGAARGSCAPLAISGSTSLDPSERRAPSLSAAGNGPTIEPAWREDA